MRSAVYHAIILPVVFSISLAAFAQKNPNICPHDSLSDPLKTIITGEIRQNQMVLHIHCLNTVKQKKNEFIYINKIEIAPRFSYERDASPVLSLTLDYPVTDTSIIIPIDLVQSDSLSAYNIKLVYKQSYIVQNWLGYKKYGITYQSYRSQFLIMRKEPKLYCGIYKPQRILRCFFPFRKGYEPFILKITPAEYARKVIPGVY